MRLYCSLCQFLTYQCVRNLLTTEDYLVFLFVCLFGGGGYPEYQSSIQGAQGLFPEILGQLGKQVSFESLKL